MNNVLRYELDEYGKVGITLGEFNSLAEMDLFMHKFKDSNMVKEYYLEKINEFLKTNMATNYLNSISGKENNGYLRGYTKDKYKYRLIPIIYQSNLVPEDEAIRRLRSKLEERKILYDIYNKKFYVLPSGQTRFLKDELHRVIGHNGSSRIFIKEFIRYIKSLKQDEKYFVLRCLCDKCHLLDKDKNKVDNLYKIRKDDKEYKLVKVRHYNVGDYSDEEVGEMIDTGDEIDLRKEVDKFFEEEFINNDMSYMLENHDIDEIDRNTNYFDNLEKSKGRGR